MAAREAALKTAALVVLLARSGDRLTFADPHRYPRPSRRRPDEVQLSLIRKSPANAELVS